MTDRWDSEYGGGTLATDPPSSEYRQVGWHCLYHEQAGRSCHNPLDCDLVPKWALTVEAAKERIKNAPRSNQA